jgi:hypothetical protein
MLPRSSRTRKHVSALPVDFCSSLNDVILIFLLVCHPLGEFVSHVAFLLPVCGRCHVKADGDLVILLNDFQSGFLLLARFAEPSLPKFLLSCCLLQTNDFALKTSAMPTIFADRILRVQREDRILRLIDRLKLVVARRNERSETRGSSSRLRNGESVPAATKQAGRSGVDGAMMFVLNRIGVDVEVDVDGDAAVGVEERAGLGRFNFFMRASKIRSKTSRWQA